MRERIKVYRAASRAGKIYDQTFSQCQWVEMAQASSGNRYEDRDRTSLVKRNTQTFSFSFSLEPKKTFNSMRNFFFSLINLSMKNLTEIIHNMLHLFNQQGKKLGGKKLKLLVELFEVKSMKRFLHAKEKNLWEEYFITNLEMRI